MPIYHVELRKVVTVTVTVEADGADAAAKAAREAYPGFTPAVVDESDRRGPPRRAAGEGTRPVGKAR